MRVVTLLFGTIILVGCGTTTLNAEPKQVLLQKAKPVAVSSAVSQSGSTFIAKFATVSALNSSREYVADYHGEMRFTVYPNEQIECRFWADGRITDKAVYEDVNGFISAVSEPCRGRLQRDNTFELRGAYTAELPSDLTAEEEPTFVINGIYLGPSIRGNLRLGSVFRNDITITEEHTTLDLIEGVAFEAILLED